MKHIPTLAALVFATSCFGQEACPELWTACGEGTVWDEVSQTCVVANVSDTDFDGCVGINDFLVHLSNFGSGCGPESAWSCGDPLEYHGYYYATVLIGEQCWFAENLITENYRDGQPITSNVSNADWITLVSGARTVYGGIEDSPCVDDYVPWNTCDTILSLEAYGRLYNWFAVNDNRHLCPLNWHVPSNFDWSELTTYLGGENIAGVAMKTEEGWYVGVGGNNSSGFSAYPGGEKSMTSYHGGGAYAIFWSQTPDESNSEYAWQWSLSGPNSPSYLNSDPWFKTSGYSVRCIQDSE